MGLAFTRHMRNSVVRGTENVVRMLCVFLLSVVAASGGACGASSESDLNSRVSIAVQAIGNGVRSYCEYQGTFEEAVEQFEDALISFGTKEYPIEIAKIAEQNVFVVFWRGADGELGNQDDICAVFPFRR
jgi:hypothetical protein